MSIQLKTKWIVPPAKMAKAIQQYGKRALTAAHAMATHVGAQMQNSARQNAKWHDRTGNARGGIFFAVDGFGRPSKQGKVQRGDGPGAAKEWKANKVAGEEASGDDRTLVLALGHTMYYGEHLELAHGGKYAIIEPTLEQYGPVLMDGLKNLFEE
jgi:hypothetical protein